MAIPQVYHHLLFRKRRDLWILDELSKNPVTSQRELSQKCEIALGMTNACIRSMTKKGWLEIRPLDHRKSGYYLTPRGLSAKASLTLDLLSCSMQYYTELKRIINERVSEMTREGRQRVVFYGVSDEMEIAYMAIQGMKVQLVGIVEDDGTFSRQIIFGFELEPVSRINDLKPDCVLVTSLQRNGEKRERLQALLNGENILITDIGPG